MPRRWLAQEQAPEAGQAGQSLQAPDQAQPQQVEPAYLPDQEAAEKQLARQPEADRQPMEQERAQEPDRVDRHLLAPALTPIHPAEPAPAQAAGQAATPMAAFR